MECSSISNVKWYKHGIDKCNSFECSIISVANIEFPVGVYRVYRRRKAYICRLKFGECFCIRPFTNNIQLNFHSSALEHPIFEVYDAWFSGIDIFLCTNIKRHTIGAWTYLILLAALGLWSAGNKSVSSISTISTSPDWISAAPSHDIIIGIQSPPSEQRSGVWKGRWEMFFNYLFLHENDFWSMSSIFVVQFFFSREICMVLNRQQNKLSVFRNYCVTKEAIQDIIQILVNSQRMFSSLFAGNHFIRLWFQCNRSVKQPIWKEPQPFPNSQRNTHLHIYNFCFIYNTWDAFCRSALHPQNSYDFWFNALWIDEENILLLLLRSYFFCLNILPLQFFSYRNHRNLPKRKDKNGEESFIFKKKLILSKFVRTKVYIGLAHNTQCIIAAYANSRYATNIVYLVLDFLFSVFFLPLLFLYFENKIIMYRTFVESTHRHLKNFCLQFFAKCEPFFYYYSVMLSSKSYGVSRYNPLRCTPYSGIRDRIMVFIFNGKKNLRNVDECEKKKIKSYSLCLLQEITDFFSELTRNCE